MLNFLYIAVSWVLLRWHQGLSYIGMDPESGITWALSIFLLVVTIRILLFRFFIKQVHTQRKTQEMQPKIQALREKYKNDRQTLSQEMLKLQREEGFNPLAGCLPILLQAPVFLALFHVLRLIGTPKDVALFKEYHWTQQATDQAGIATLFHAPIASAFSDKRDLAGDIAGASGTAIKIVAGILIVCMVAATYITQRQIMARSNTVLDGQQAMIQKLLLYGMPASLAVSGFFFPIGVLLYWFANNLWTMGQQFYILKRMPHPNQKKDALPSAEAKALAPKVGQKPVNPKRKLPAKTLPAKTTPAKDAAGKDGAAKDAPAKGTPAKGTAAKKPAKGTPIKGTPIKGTPAKAGGTDEPAPDPTEDAPIAADADADDSPNGDAPAADGSAAASANGSGGSTGGGARPQRRPPNRRSSTTTRPKKKRR